MRAAAFVIGFVLLRQPLVAQTPPSDTLALRAYSDSLHHILSLPHRPEPRDLRAQRLAALTPPAGFGAAHHDLIVAEWRAADVERRFWQRAGQDREQCLQRPNAPDPDCARAISGAAGDPRLREANLQVGRAIKVITTRLKDGLGLQAAAPD